ncbi:hypothetical protein [Nitratireductor luteus]|uniref:Abi-alpha family protein n=1 Tax=Nitratireductor luteus TaxID=2976980 RepID=UPI00223EAFDE|nr:hypothetical protein [Nitratireductor luteus]
MPILSDEEAKAAQETAKFGQKGIEAAASAGSYLTGTFHGAIKFLAMTAEDWAAGLYIRNRAAIEVKTRNRLEELGVDRDFRPIGERNYLSLLEAISLESDEGLQDIWATYIASAMNPSKTDIGISRQLIEVIKHLEPEDLPVLRRLSYEDLAEPRKDPIRLKASDFPVGEPALATSLSRLAAIGLFSFDNDRSIGWSGPENWSKPCQLEITVSLGNFRAQPLLLQLQRSVDYGPTDFAEGTI